MIATIQPGDAAPTGERAWRAALQHVITRGDAVRPRDKLTTELMQHSVTLDLARPVVTAPRRKLNYRFMCAEALWIIGGSNELAPLTRFVKRMADFSDDGVTLAGAYGPRIVPQLMYLLKTLVNDPSTRQAALSIWTPSPAPSKDIPCTLAMTFNIRQGRLHQHVMMRSSDLWLGLPYDMFSFGCVGICLACMYNDAIKQYGLAQDLIGLGHLTVTATSSHLYEENLGAAQEVLAAPEAAPVAPCPSELVVAGAWKEIYADLLEQREGRPARRWRVTP